MSTTTQCPKCKIVIGACWAGGNCPGCNHVLEAARSSEGSVTCSDWIFEAEAALAMTQRSATSAESAENWTAHCALETARYHIERALEAKPRPSQIVRDQGHSPAKENL